MVGQHQSNAQLITDSENKLKTQKSKNKGGGSLFGNKKKGGSSSSSSASKANSSSPRYSSGSPFASFNKRNSASPRVSQNRQNLFKSYQNKSPRYSSGGMAGVLRSKQSSPRYSSSSSSFSKNRIAVSPRYSSGSQFSRKDQPSPTRYSMGSPFSPKERGQVAPRYSAGSPFTKKDQGASSRYSAGKPFSRKDVAVSPRYSGGSPFGPKDQKAAPRYSAGSPFGKNDQGVSPRYSAGSPYNDMNWDWIKPAYSTNKHRFDVNKKKRQEYVYDDTEANYQGFSRKRLNWLYSVENIVLSNKTKSFEASAKIPRYDPQQQKSSSDYMGNYKLKWINTHEMHPSSKYSHAHQDSEMLRKSLRKWNLMWTRMNGNKEQPDAVTDKISKPKFDRKEAEIWND